MGDCTKFFGRGIGGENGINELIDYAYSAAYFWRLDPFVVMSMPIPDVVELTQQAHRINKEMAG